MVRPATARTSRAAAREAVLPDPDRGAVGGDDRVAVLVERDDHVAVAGVRARRAVAVVPHGAAPRSPHHHAVTRDEHAQRVLRRAMSWRTPGLPSVSSWMRIARGVCEEMGWSIELAKSVDGTSVTLRGDVAERQAGTEPSS